MQSNLDELVTEARGAEREDYADRETRELVELMNRGDAAVPGIVAGATSQIAAAIDAIAARLTTGGRLVYVGAGTSGGLAALDAAECQSTFSAPSGQVVAIVAGGSAASPAEQAAAEDDSAAGAEAIATLEVGKADAVVGVSASGRTPFTLGAIEAAAAAGAVTVALVSVDDSDLANAAEHEIAIVVGPEFISGSTRLKAGTAQKLVLNAISTITMIRLGKTFGDLMVDVAPTNDKLRARVRRIIQTATGASAAQVDDALAAADGNAKVAIVSLLAGVDPDVARARLQESGGHIRPAVDAS